MIGGLLGYDLVGILCLSLGNSKNWFLGGLSTMMKQTSRPPSSKRCRNPHEPACP